MKKGKRTIGITAIIGLALLLTGAYSRAAMAASAIAFDRETSTYEVAHNAQSESLAKSRAFDGCRQRGGRNCQIITSCATGGYGAVAMRRLPGRPIEAIGAVCGASDGEQALQLAAQECNKHAVSNRCGRPTVGWFDNR